MRSIFFGLWLVLEGMGAAHSRRWPSGVARDWYSEQGRLVGSNYIPATAINQLEMWRAETIDPQRIDLKLGWAEGLGVNRMRVFPPRPVVPAGRCGLPAAHRCILEDCSQGSDSAKFRLFDSCRDPRSRWGRQRTPMPGMHNSEWVQSPGGKRSKTPAHDVRLEAYAKGVMGAFANDRRILAWDIWNEPDNLNTGSYDNLEPANKVALVLALLPRAFEVGSRGASSPERLTASEKAQLEMVGRDLVPQLRRAGRF